MMSTIPASVETEGVIIRVKFEEVWMPASIVGDTLAIDGHGQPADKRSQVSIRTTGNRMSWQMVAVYRFLRSKGYDGDVRLTLPEESPDAGEDS